LALVSALPEAACAVDANFDYLEKWGPRTKAWVAAHNHATTSRLTGDRRYPAYLKSLLENADRERRSGQIGPGRLFQNRDWVYNVDVGAAGGKGVLRRSELQAFIHDDNRWQDLLDFDKLNRLEGRSWTLIQLIFSPSGKRCLLQLTDPSSSKVDWREFDVTEARLVEGGFSIDAIAPAGLAWKSDDAVILISEQNAGSEESVAGPSSVRLWRRGKKIDQSQAIFPAERVGAPLGLFSNEDHLNPGENVVHICRQSGENRIDWWAVGPRLELTRAAGPLCTDYPYLFEDHYILRLQSDWSDGEHKAIAGSLVAIARSEMHEDRPRLEIIRPPTPDTAVIRPFSAAGALFVQANHLAKGQVWRARRGETGWRCEVIGLADQSVFLFGGDSSSHVAFARAEGLLQPPSLLAIGADDGPPIEVARGYAGFDTTRFVIEELEAVSSDGVAVPYSLVKPRSLQPGRISPVLINGYGAHGIPNSAGFSNALGQLWLEQGGLYVHAYVRGGNERGPKWEVRGRERQHTYDDLVAISKDLIARKLTAPKRLAFIGHSSGGLLGGVMLTQHADLFGAIVLKAAVLDLLRLDLLEADIKISEADFGSVTDPRAADFVKRTSPQQGLRRGGNLPIPLIITSTTDTRVEPAQSRRFAARMESLGHKALFYEVPEGGHGLARTPDERAHLDALVYTYLAQQMHLVGVSTQ
jgi:prolyl oligopeptidase